MMIAFAFAMRLEPGIEALASMCKRRLESLKLTFRIKVKASSYQREKQLHDQLIMLLSLVDIPELSPDISLHNQSFIGILHWIVKLGHVDMIVKVSMTSYIALPNVSYTVSRI